MKGRDEHISEELKMEYEKHLRDTGNEAEQKKDDRERYSSFIGWPRF